MRTPTRTAVFLATCSLAALAASCGTEPPPPPPYSARPVVEIARWQVVNGDAVIGRVLHLEIRDPQGPVGFYRVEDVQGRWLGFATMNGRFSRRVPFQDREEDLGVWPMARGTALLFDAASPVTLRPVAVDADARPSAPVPR